MRRSKITRMLARAGIFSDTRHQNIVVLACGLLASIAVAGPLTSRGWLLLLDSVPGPHSHLPRAAWGLDGGLTAAMPFTISYLLLGKLIGQATTGWIPIAIFFPIAFLGISRLVGGNLLTRISAGVFYAFTPIVFERTWAGHVAYLLGYALLPFIARALIDSSSASGFRRLAAVPWIALAGGMGVHYLWISGVLICAVVVYRRCSWRAILVALATVIFVMLSSFYLVSAIQSGSDASANVSNVDLHAYATRSDPHLGLLLNVATLYGFWRSEPPLPKDGNHAWPILEVTIALVIGIGVWFGIKKKDARPAVAVAAMTAVAGFILALGTQGPFGDIFQWMFNHIPGFKVMREPQKFAVLLAMGYAVGFGNGVSALVDRSRGAKSIRLALGAALLVSPIAATPTILWGLGGRLHPGQYPPSWTQAQDVMGNSDGKVLVLPWHEYLGFNFTNGRTVAQPASTFFSRPSIQGDNVELPNVPTTSTSAQSQYITSLLSMGRQMTDFGHLVAPLGVEYIFLEKATDWPAYDWLKSQVDLVPILDDNSVALYRNSASFGIGKHMNQVISVKSVADLITIPSSDLDHAAVMINSSVIPSDSSTSTLIKKVSPTSYLLGATQGGMDVIAEPFNREWGSSKLPVVQLASGTIGVPGSHNEQNLQFKLWSSTRNRYVLSAFAFFFILMAQLYEFMKSRP